MKYRLGNSQFIKSSGETSEIICPNCSEAVKFSVFSNLDTRLVSKLFFIDFKNVYLLVCPECASMYTVDDKKGRQLHKGNSLAIKDSDLMPLTPYRKDNDNA